MQQMVYHSKKDWWLVALVWVGVLIPLGIGIYSRIGIYSLITRGGDDLAGWTLLVASISIAAFVLLLTYPLYYEITAAKLIVRCGVVVRKEIPLSSIVETRSIRNPGSAPAWSLDRLQIDYEKEGGVSSVLISPRDKLGFLRELAGKAGGLEVRGADVVRIS
jgi:hypothetical protein